MKYRGRNLPNTQDPFEIADEMMALDGVARCDSSMDDFYFKKAQELIKKNSLALNSKI